MGGLATRIRDVDNRENIQEATVLLSNNRFDLASVHRMGIGVVAVHFVCRDYVNR